MEKNNLDKLLRFAAIFGNIIYVLWILRNGINEGFKATPVQAVSLSGLLVLLILNAVLIYRKK